MDTDNVIMSMDMTPRHRILTQETLFHMKGLISNCFASYKERVREEKREGEREREREIF